ncbi:MAG TPA: T9SS type A sorting domain-containing protein [Pedobacter sp.]|jgi:hypothetical protein
MINSTHFKYLACLGILLTFFISQSKAQAQLSFSYDAAGNQITRQWICVNCPTGQATAAPSDQLIALDKALLGPEADVAGTRSLKAYPNPVTENLQVEWSASEGIFIKSLEVFSITGTRLFDETYRKGHSDASISFLRMTPGVYVLRATYSDGKKENVKIIKQ